MPGQTLYPGALDTTTNLPDVSGKNLGGNADPNADHSNVTDTQSTAIISLEQKVGIGTSPASSSATGTFLGKNSDGTTGWQLPPTGSGISVTPAPFAVVYPGATTIAKKSSDGTTISSGTNVATVINATIVAASAESNGGVIQLASGLFPDTTEKIVIAPSNGQVILTGAGAQLNRGSNTGVGTVLRAGVGFTAGSSVIEVGTSGTVTDGVTIANIVVDANNKDIYGIKAADARQMEFTNMNVLNASASTRRGIWLTGTLLGNAGGVGPRIAGCYIRNCASGLYVDGLGTTDGILSHSRINSGARQIDILAGGWQLLGCHFTGSGASTQLNVFINGSPSIVTGNYFDSVGSGNPNLHIKCVKSTFTGNFFVTASGESTAHSIKLEFDRNVIVGNTFTTDGGAFIKSIGSSIGKGIYTNNGGTGTIGGVVQNASGVEIPNGTSGTGLIIENNFVV